MTMKDSVMMAELAWTEYHRKVRDGQAKVLLPIGALEQHGPHMSMNPDVLIPTAVCARVAQAAGGLVAPAFAYGYKSQQKSGGGNHMPGTTSLDGATMSSTVKDVLRELALFGALMKRSELKGEDEWRVILCNPSQTAVGARRIRAIAKPEYTSLYIDLEIADATDRLPLCEILIGPGDRQQMTARAFWTLLYKHGYERADVIQSAL